MKKLSLLVSPRNRKMLLCNHDVAFPAIWMSVCSGTLIMSKQLLGSVIKEVLFPALFRFVLVTLKKIIFAGAKCI